MELVCVHVQNNRRHLWVLLIMYLLPNFSIKCQHLIARENNVFKKDVTEGRILKSSTAERLLGENLIFMTVRAHQSLLNQVHI